METATPTGSVKRMVTAKGMETAPGTRLARASGTSAHT
jgi:hypothetical protein